MPTSTISNTVTNPSGTALAGVPIIVRLVPRGGFRITDASEVTPVVTTTTNASGVWSLALERNSNITPANSYYEVEEQCTAAQGGPRKYTFQVGASNATLYASLISAIPDLTSSNYLTQAAADARYLLLSGGFGVAGDMVVSRPADTASAGTQPLGARIDHVHDREQIYGTAAERAALSGSDLYNGLRFQESDTGFRYVRIGAAWVFDEQVQGWSTYTPVITQGASTVTHTDTRIRYCRVGRLIIGHVRCTLTSAGTGNNAIIVTAPVTAASTTSEENCGTGTVQDTGTAAYPAIVRMSNGTFKFLRTDIATPTNYIGADPNFALANTDELIFGFQYEAAS